MVIIFDLYSSSLTYFSNFLTASAQKNVIANAKNNQNEKPKALKKIDLTAQISQASKIVPTNATAVTTAPRKIISTQDKKASENKLAPILPDPRNAKIVKPVLPRSHLKPTQSFNFSSITAPKSRTNTVPKQKPAFNLSTQLFNTLSTNKSTSSSANTSNIENKMVSTQDKMAARLQRHMDLFKGRVPAARAGVASRKNEAAIKGVRSNRRFELQMKHRKNAEN